MDNKSILVFGAGKIGRSFIGQLFGLSGYKVVFSDIDQKLVSNLNNRKCYRVIFKGEKEEACLVENVSAVWGMDRELVTKEVVKASILAVSVGKNALEKVIPLIAKGLIERYKTEPGKPLDIIIAENMRFSGEFIRQRLFQYLPKRYPLDKLVGLVETCIGKMAPDTERENSGDEPLAVIAEPYNDLIVDKKGFRNDIPDVKGIIPKENIKAWVDRKLFVHNLGHSTTAYFGAYKHPGAIYIYEVLKDREVYSFTRKVMCQAAAVLQAVYPDEFTKAGLGAHIDDLLLRFQNESLKDTIIRVGQDLPRKLGPDDRFIGIIRLAIELNMEYNCILEALVCGFLFRSNNSRGAIHPADEAFYQVLSSGLDNALENFCGMDLQKDRLLVDGFKELYSQMKDKLYG